MSRRRDTRHPAMCANVTPGGLHFRIHEPTVWRLADFYERLRLGRMTAAAAAAAAGGAGGDHSAGGAATKAAAVEDPVMTLGLLRLSPLAAKITFKPAPDRRPSSVGPAVASVLAFLNLDRLPVSIGGVAVVVPFHTSFFSPFFLTQSSNQETPATVIKVSARSPFSCIQLQCSAVETQTRDRMRQPLEAV